MSRKKKKNSYRPSSIKNIVNRKDDLFSPKSDFEKVIFFNSNSIKIPYGKSHGTDAERKVMDILESSHIPNSMVLKPKLVKVPLSGEIEISDGIILYGDTAFLMQIKSRNITDDEIKVINDSIQNGDSTLADSEIRKIEKLVSHAYKQCNKSLSYIEDNEEIDFENQSGEIVKIKYSDYNWVSLILINHPNLSEINSVKIIKEDSNNNRKIPRVIMSVQDLESMSSGFHRIPYYILNYLRRIQYQDYHEIGNDARRFTNFMVTGIHDYEKNNYFIEYEKFIMELYETKRIDKDIAQHLLYPLDYTKSDTMEELQKSFESKFSKRTDLPSKDLVVYSETRVGYATLFYDSRDLPTDQITTEQLEEICADYYIRNQQYIDIMVTIAVDIRNKNSHRTVGYLAGFYNPKMKNPQQYKTI